MLTTRTDKPHTDIVSLEMSAALARRGFACMFSTSEEYEHALIAARRAEGRYAQPRPNREPIILAGVALVLGAAVLLMI